MDLEFADDDLDRLETDPAFTMGRSPAVVKAYRKRVQQIRAASDERDFYGLKSLHFERLKGERQSTCSMKLNDQYRLILELRGSAGEKRVRILGIDDYH